MPADIAVIITCHEPYLHWLPEAMASVRRQSVQPAECAVVFDGSQQVPAPGGGWKSASGNWHHPSPARNVGVALTAAPWLIFLDADNVLPDGYLEAMQRVIDAASSDIAIVYPNIEFTDEWLRPRRLWEMPAWDYWRMRRHNCIDTSSAWRREAIELAGGWSREYHEDYLLALEITAAGWKAVRLDSPAMLMREHNCRRGLEGPLLAHLWKARTLGIVSLLAGRRATLERWRRFLLSAELPRRTALYVVDNSGDPAFTRQVHAACESIAAERGLSHLDIAITGQSYDVDPREPYLTKHRHLHVAQLYAATLPRVAEDLVLTLEDDVEPPVDAVRALGEEIGYPSRAEVGVVAAAYASPTSRGNVCAGRDDGEAELGASLAASGWGYPVSWGSLPLHPVDVGCVGGGCAVWANWALRECVPHVHWPLKLGWDGVVCRTLRQKGYRVWLHGGVRCEHHLHGALSGQLPSPPALTVRPRAAPPRVAV